MKGLYRLCADSNDLRLQLLCCQLTNVVTRLLVKNFYSGVNLQQMQTSIAFGTIEALIALHWMEVSRTTK